MLVFFAACVPEHPLRSDHPLPEDTGGGVDTAETGDTVDTVDTTDTTDTAPVDTGSLHAEVSFGGAPSSVDCGGGAGTFVHSFVDAMGNVAGELSCTDVSGDQLRILFTAGAVGAWTEPGAADFRWTSVSGGSLYWGMEGATTSSWTLAFTTFERTSTSTIDVVASFSGTWVDDGDGVVGSITGDAAATLDCPGCP